VPATRGGIDMTVKIGINGFGRIGRNFFRAARQRGVDFDFVAANDIMEPRTAAHLLKYDSVLGRFDGTVEATAEGLVVDGKALKILSERDPANLPWKELGDAFGIDRGLMTTIHAYTNDQNLLDLTHKDLRRARAAAINIVPASTGAAKASSLALPSLKGKMDGVAMRVPVPDGSVTDLVCVLSREATVEEVNEAFRAASEQGSLAGKLAYTED